MIPTQRRSRPRPSGREQSLEGGGIENRHRLEGALDLLEVHSRFLDQPQKMNRFALSQSGRMGPPNNREQRTGGHDDVDVKCRYERIFRVSAKIKHSKLKESPHIPHNSRAATETRYISLLVTLVSSLGDGSLNGLNLLNLANARVSRSLTITLYGLS